MKHLIFLFFVLSFIACSKNEITIVISEDADKIEKLAATELTKYLSAIYPASRFTVSNSIGVGKCVYLGTHEHLLKYKLDSIMISNNEQGFAIAEMGETSSIITSKSSIGVLQGVYTLLEKEGYSFVFNGDNAPSIKRQFDFKSCNLSDEPLVNERTVFNWHNFLSGCTGWDLEDWIMWTGQAQKMGYNTIMVHAYANNPIYTFQYNGIEKRVGYLATSEKGRDWSTEHVNDVRRLPGGYLFKESVFGSKAAKVPEEQKVEKAQKLMKDVFQYAEDRGVDVNLAIDFDIVAAIPQDMVLTLPEEERFLVQHKGIEWMGEKAGPVWIPRPDKPMGYNYYKTQVKRVLYLYPQIDIFTLWRRASGSVWVELELGQLPNDWQYEYRKYISEFPDAGKMEQSVGAFAQAKLAKAYIKAFAELGREDVKLCFGTWQWGPLKALNEFLPDEVAVYILDSEVIRGEKHLHNKEMVSEIAGWIKSGKVIPVIWPHHDDGAYIGSPLNEHSNFYETLSLLKANGFGVIHWMTRPFDSFFIHHIKQVHKSTKNQALEATMSQLASKWFGEQNKSLMKDYLLHWDKDMPTFGRETTPDFIDQAHYFKFKDVKKILKLCEERIKLLERIDKNELNEMQLGMWNFFLNFEIFVRDFFIEQDKYLKASKYLEERDVAKAIELMRKFNPEAVLQQYAKTIECGTVTKGEKGLLFSMGVRWLPQFISLKQMVGLEDIRINFNTTSHEEMAQMPGFRTYFIDKDQKYWITLGEKEMGCPVVDTNYKNEEIFEKGIVVVDSVSVQLKPYALNKNISPGKYKIELYLADFGNAGELEVSVDNTIKQNLVVQNNDTKYIDVELENTVVPTLQLKAVKGKIILCGIVIHKIKE